MAKSLWKFKKVIYEFADGTVADSEGYIMTPEQEKEIIRLLCAALGLVVTFAD
jgi:hypothetical protein